MFENSPMIHRAILTLLLITSAGGALHAEEPSVETTWLAPNDSARIEGDTDYHCFMIAVPLPGVATLDAAVSGEAPPPRLALARPAGKAPSKSHVLDQRVDHRTLAFLEPGSQRFCVSAQDPLQTLHGLSVRTAFAAFEGDAGPGLVAKEEEYDDEIEIEPGHLWTPALPAFDAADLCRLGGDDDHGDTFLCATSLGSGLRAAGELAGGLREDRDVFTFVVARLGTLEIISSGAEVYGSLLNEVGDRLAVGSNSTASRGTASRGTASGGFRLVKTLAPGRYYVVVEGSRRADSAPRAASEYMLEVASIDGW